MRKTCRFLFVPLFAICSGSAVAQYAYPWGYAPYPQYPAYPPRYAPTPPGYAPGASYPPNAAPAPSNPRSMLDAHNAVRARVGVPPLVWSGQLAAAAQEWANYLVASGTFSHRTGDRYGENLYAMTGGYVSPDQVVYAWAEEARGYDVRTNACAGVCGHYTQIVWRTTRALGCAVALGRGRQVWVCEYDPPGNVVGYRPF